VLELFPPAFPNIHADHLTIKYDISSEEISSLEIGKKVSLKVIGLAQDDKAQAILIETGLSSNQFPHITISTAEGTRPVYSNELIEKKGYKKLDIPVLIEGVVGMSDGKNVTLSRMEVNKIILPTRIQPDTLLAIFLLKTFGKSLFPGSDKAVIEFWPLIPEGETSDSLGKKGVLLLDIGGGDFDHHQKIPQTTTSYLVGEVLGVREKAALAKLFEYTKRDDFYGKGTISEDPLDRAFGLSGLMTALNKNYKDSPSKIVDILLPLIEAHYLEEVRRTEELPRELAEIEKAGEVISFQVKQRDKNLKVIIIESSNPSMPGFLRSSLGGNFDVVALVLPSGHINILTKPIKKVDLRSLAALIRHSEFILLKMPYDKDMKVLAQTGRLEALPGWYYDTATNSILNGGVTPESVIPTKIKKEQLHKIMELGLSEQLWSPVK
jgi:hypothetical protein